MKAYRNSLLSLAMVTTLAAPVAAAPTMVAFPGDAPQGTIVVDTSERQLYLVLDDGNALRYPVAVGRAGREWTGATKIEGKFIAPHWAPPAEIRRDNPNLPDVIPSGSPANPVGAAALTLTGGLLAIHGTNDPDSIGKFASYGCIRMYNKDITDLFDRVRVGTPVYVMQ